MTKLVQKKDNALLNYFIQNYQTESSIVKNVSEEPSDCGLLME